MPKPPDHFGDLAEFFGTTSELTVPAHIVGAGFALAIVPVLFDFEPATAAQGQAVGVAGNPPAITGRSEDLDAVPNGASVTLPHMPGAEFRVIERVRDGHGVTRLDLEEI